MQKRDRARDRAPALWKVLALPLLTGLLLAGSVLAARPAAAAPEPLPKDGKVHEALIGLVPQGVTVSCPNGQGGATLDSLQRWVPALPDPTRTTRCRLILAVSINPLYDRQEFGRLFAQNNGLVSIRFESDNALSQVRFNEESGTSGDGPSWHVRGDGVLLFSIGLSPLLEKSRSLAFTFGMRVGPGLSTQIYSRPIRVAVPAPVAPVPPVAGIPDTGQPRIAYRPYRVTLNCDGTPQEFTRNGAAWLAPSNASFARSQHCTIDAFFERHPQAQDSDEAMNRQLHAKGLVARIHQGNGFRSVPIDTFGDAAGNGYLVMNGYRFVAYFRLPTVLPSLESEFDLYVPVTERTWLISEVIKLQFLW